MRQLTKPMRRRDSELTLSIEDPRTSRTQDASGEEKEAVGWDSEATSRTDHRTTSRMDDALGEENEALRRDSESISRRDDLTTSRTDDVHGEENEALRSYSKSTSRMDNACGEEYDVVLSFRGPDTRNGFTDYLYHGLRGAGIRIFLDSEELEDGAKVSEILKAVDESRIYMSILSQNFTSSVWCLREVERMVECYSKSNGKKEIIPIFYDVKLRTDLYKNAILKHRKKFASKEVQQWEAALKTVGKIIGREIPGKRDARRERSFQTSVFI